MDMPLLSHPNPAEVTRSIKASALVFEDESSQRLLERIQLIAPSDLNALIIGETGTGKELVARHIHELSRRKQGPFLAVNCGALSETLVESELFGHEKGAFTGANSERKGWFEAAHGGTIFLDEIGDLPPQIQVKLLRVLQEQEVVRVGSYRPIPINVRVVAATNVKLEEAVVSGRFREDLYYRLNVAALHLSPLRDRPGDILPLARHFLAFYGKRLGLESVLLLPCAREALAEHPWPGNIRELENVIHHALLVSRGGEVSGDDLHLSNFSGRSSSLQGGSREGAFSGTPLDQLRSSIKRLCDEEHPSLYHAVEREVLKTAYEASNRNQLATARLLGLSRHVVRARLLEHGLLISANKVVAAPSEQKESAHPVDHALEHFVHFISKTPVTTLKTAGDSHSDWWGF